MNMQYLSWKFTVGNIQHTRHWKQNAPTQFQCRNLVLHEHLVDITILLDLERYGNWQWNKTYLYIKLKGEELFQCRNLVLDEHLVDITILLNHERHGNRQWNKTYLYIKLKSWCYSPKIKIGMEIFEAQCLPKRFIDWMAYIPKKSTQYMEME